MHCGARPFNLRCDAQFREARLALSIEIFIEEVADFAARE
jgi:hypothetical protein